MKPLTLTESAQFLRMSRSNLYQRKDIPRYRRPGSRVLLFDQDELEVWLKQGRVDSNREIAPKLPTLSLAQAPEAAADAVDIHCAGVYHRNPRYR